MRGASLVAACPGPGGSPQLRMRIETRDVVEGREVTYRAHTLVRPEEEISDAVGGKNDGEWRPYLDSNNELRAALKFKGEVETNLRVGISKMEARDVFNEEGGNTALDRRTLHYINRDGKQASYIKGGAQRGVNFEDELDGYEAHLREAPRWRSGVHSFSYLDESDTPLGYIAFRMKTGNGEDSSKLVSIRGIQLVEGVSPNVDISENELHLPWPTCDAVKKAVRGKLKDGSLDKDDVPVGKLIRHQKEDGTFRLSVLTWRDKENGKLDQLKVQCPDTGGGPLTQEDLDLILEIGGKYTVDDLANMEELSRVFGEFWE